MKKTSISIVGSGNVGTHMALALHAAGCEIRQVLSRTFDHAQLLAMRVDARPIDDWRKLDEDVDVCLLCVSDDVLYDLALDLRLPDTLVVHTSGATPAVVLKGISHRYGVLWSPQTFVRDIAMDYSSLPLCVEGNNLKSESEIAGLAAMVSSNVFHLGLVQRRKAHLAAVLVSNFVNAINAEAQEYMNEAGLDFTMLRPLAEQTLRKWDYGPLWAQQTGPARRSDSRTIAAQRKLIADNPELLRIYDMFTELIQSK